MILVLTPIQNGYLEGSCYSTHFLFEVQPLVFLLLDVFFFSFCKKQQAQEGPDKTGNVRQPHLTGNLSPPTQFLRMQ